MTTGSRTLGDLDGDFYFTKDWSGADGKYDSNHKLIEHPYSCTLSQFRKAKSLIRINLNDPCGNPNYWVDCSVLLSDPWTSNDELKLLGRLADSVRGHTFDLGNFLGEGKEALGSALGALNSIHSSIRDLKKGNLSGALRSLALAPSQRGRKRLKSQLDSGDVSGTWLSMQYGWLPLLSDTYAAAKAFEVLTSGPRSQRFRASHRAVIKGDASASPPNYRCDGKRTHTAYIKYTLLEELSTPRSLGLLDPLGVAWEVLPWSFVADWFLPIGDYLDALSIFPYLKGSYVMTHVIHQDSRFSYGINPTFTCSGHYHDYWHKVISRTVGNSLSVPLPSFNNPFQALGAGKRLLNAAGLIHQLLR